MSKKCLALSSAVLAMIATNVVAGERYEAKPPIIIAQSLTKPWIIQLGGPVKPVVIAPVRMNAAGARRVVVNRRAKAQAATQVVYRADQPATARLDPQYLPQVVDYQTTQKPGTIVIDTDNRFLYLVAANGKARRYGVGVGKPGFEWAGAHRVTRKAEWPGWTPPKEMITREAARGHFLPAHMEGGEANPLGARAMYLGSSLYRIHGTNAPWTIGYAVSSGCIRMRNQDVVDLYERVKVGTRVIVL